MDISCSLLHYWDRRQHVRLERNIQRPTISRQCSIVSNQDYLSSGLKITVAKGGTANLSE